MTLLDEIRYKCSPAMIAAGEHGQIAALVSEGRTRVGTRIGGIGLVLNTLGPTGGAMLLDQLEAQAPNVSALKWALVLLNRGELDFGSDGVRGMIDQLLPPDVAAVLKSVAVYDDPVTVSQVIDALASE